MSALTKIEDVLVKYAAEGEEVRTKLKELSLTENERVALNKRLESIEQTMQSLTKELVVTKQMKMAQTADDEVPLAPEARGLGLSLDASASVFGGQAEERMVSMLVDSNESLLFVRVIRAAGLAPRTTGRKASPFCTLCLASSKKAKPMAILSRMNTNAPQLSRLRTTTLHDTLNPVWNESVCFPLTSDRDFLILHIWCYDPVRRNDFMGEVRVPWWEYEDSTVQKTWFELSLRKDGKYRECQVSGAVFIQFIYHLRPTFNPAASLLGQSTLMPKLMSALLDDDLILATVLFENLERTKTLQTREGGVVLKSILTLFQNQSFNSTMNLLRVRIKQEVARTKNSSNLFRANTAATVLLTQYALQVGQKYLENLLKPLINKLIASPNSCEIDPMRLNADEDISVNQAHLMKTCEEFLTIILESLDSLPTQFRWVAHILALEISKAKFEDKDDAIRVSIASLYFLRFVCPAIVDPGRYNLVDKTPGTMARRSLILVAKVLQNIANVGSSASFYVKEQHMGAMLGILEANAERVAHFFEALTVVSVSRVRLTFENLDPSAREDAMVNVLSYAKQHKDDIRKTILAQLQNLPRSKEFRRRASFMTDTDSPRQAATSSADQQQQNEDRPLQATAASSSTTSFTTTSSSSSSSTNAVDRKRGVSTPPKRTGGSGSTASVYQFPTRSLTLSQTNAPVFSTPSSSSSASFTNGSPNPPSPTFSSFASGKEGVQHNHQDSFDSSKDSFGSFSREISTPHFSSSSASDPSSPSSAAAFASPFLSSSSSSPISPSSSTVSTTTATTTTTTATILPPSMETSLPIKLSAASSDSVSTTSTVNPFPETFVIVSPAPSPVSESTSSPSETAVTNPTAIATPVLVSVDIAPPPRPPRPSFSFALLQDSKSPSPRVSQSLVPSDDPSTLTVDPSGRLLTPTEQKNGDSPGTPRRSSGARRPLPAFNMSATPETADTKTEVWNDYEDEIKTQQSVRATMVAAVFSALDLDCTDDINDGEEVPQVAQALSLFAPTQELLEQIWAEPALVPPPQRPNKKFNASFKKASSRKLELPD